ncbi:MAG: hypothetical protein C6I00_05080 [Nitratiruptor sp.]|nr:hypothetical protein [Nitratiruptor sp.]NPA84284.1 hypothetical protein [Campylobacterota bacterium]
MGHFTICILPSPSQTVHEHFIDGLQANRHHIDQILYAGSTSPIEGAIPCPVEGSNEARMRNELMSRAKAPYLLWLTPETILEEDTLDEYLHLLQEHPDTDLIYPNEIFHDANGERVRNYTDWSNQEEALLQSLTIEKYLPKWGVAQRLENIKELGGFEERYGPQSFYGFVYKHLPQLSLRRSDLAFVHNYERTTFTDTSYHSRLLRDIVEIYPLTQLFASLNWQEEAIARATAYTLIAQKLMDYLDYFNASEFLRQALMSFHNQESVQHLIQSYLMMGLFEEALQIVDSQGLEAQKAQEWRERIEEIKGFVAHVETSIQGGLLQELLAKAQEILDYYGGAPIYNAYGVIHHLLGNEEEAYRFFYKGATIAPIDNDILENLAQVAKRLHKEEEVIGLLERITK